MFNLFNKAIRTENKKASIACWPPVFWLANLLVNEQGQIDQKRQREIYTLHNNKSCKNTFSCATLYISLPVNIYTPRMKDILLFFMRDVNRITYYAYLF